jgi:hypothetical protein
VNVSRGTDTALLLEDRLDDAGRDQLLAWVAEGGVLVVTDPSSPLTPAPASTVSGDFGLEIGKIDRGQCTIDALVGVNAVYAAGGPSYQVGPGDGHCLGGGSSAFVVSRAHGAGWVVSIGSPGTFTNEHLGAYDDSVLAANLLAPVAGTRVAFLAPAEVGVGTTSLADLIAHRFKLFAAELLVAFVIYALWRARRLGRPVSEPQPVPIAGSELVAAVGNLLQQSNAPDRAAELLRADLRRTLVERLGAPAGAPVEVLAEVAASRSGVARERVVAALSTPITTDADLAALARSVESIRQEVLHGQSVAG